MEIDSHTWNSFKTKQKQAQMVIQWLNGIENVTSEDEIE